MILQATVMKYIPTNAYFYIDNETKHGFLIDPGAQADKLLAMISDKGFVIERILLTHGHFDHIGAVEKIRQALSIPVCMQANGRAYAENPVWNLSAQTGTPITLPEVTYLPDYSTISLDASPACDLTLIPVPGHTTDGAMYYTKKDGVAFVGDSIFQGSYGRTDMYGGDEATLLQNIREKILTLPDETILLSGHSAPTTVRDEKDCPFYRA